MGDVKHEHHWVKSVDRFTWECGCGVVVTKDELYLLGMVGQVSDSDITRYVEEVRDMRKYGVGEVLPEPGDAPAQMTEEDLDELADELADDPSAEG